MIVVALVVGFRALYPPQSADIFLINDGAGETSVSGILLKDTAVGIEGNYLLTIDGEPPVLLDITSNIDSLVGQRVSVDGYYTPKLPTGQPATLKVSTIKVQ